LFFRVDDLDAALLWEGETGAPLEVEPLVNPNTRTMEFSLRDPVGYYVMISAGCAQRGTAGRTGSSCCSRCTRRRRRRCRHRRRGRRLIGARRRCPTVSTAPIARATQGA
jgi:hypothetical protein